MEFSRKEILSAATSYELLLRADDPIANVYVSQNLPEKSYISKGDRLMVSIIGDGYNRFEFFTCSQTRLLRDARFLIVTGSAFTLHLMSQQLGTSSE